MLRAANQLAATGLGLATLRDRDAARQWGAETDSPIPDLLGQRTDSALANAREILVRYLERPQDNPQKIYEFATAVKL